MDRPRVKPEYLLQLHCPRSAGWWRLVVFVSLYLAAALATFALVSARPLGGWTYLACLPLYLLAAASLHGVSLFTHEAVHGTLCRNRILNDSLGAVCAWPVLQNFSAYKVLHLRHHDHLGLPGDPDHYQN
jgi:fatty acid desaturase